MAASFPSVITVQAPITSIPLQRISLFLCTLPLFSFVSCVLIALVWHFDDTTKTHCQVRVLCTHVLGALIKSRCVQMSGTRTGSWNYSVSCNRTGSRNYFVFGSRKYFFVLIHTIRYVLRWLDTSRYPPNCEFCLSSAPSVHLDSWTRYPLTPKVS